jgi:hypothetical protein
MPNLIPKAPAESKPIQVATVPAKKKSVSVAPPTMEMRAPPSIDELLKNIKQSVVPPAGNGPPPPEKVGKATRNKPGSTGKNSVVIKL